MLYFSALADVHDAREPPIRLRGRAHGASFRTTNHHNIQFCACALFCIIISPGYKHALRRTLRRCQPQKTCTAFIMCCPCRGDYCDNAPTGTAYLLLEKPPTLLEEARRVLALLSYSLRPRVRHPLVAGVLGRHGVAKVLEDLCFLEIPSFSSIIACMKAIR